MAGTWKDLQKDLDSRKYKSNPFEKKYVDLVQLVIRLSRTISASTSCLKVFVHDQI